MKFTELLKPLAARPGMYISERSIHCLKAFIDGFTLAAEDDSESEEFMHGFQQWIESRFEVSTTQSWAQIINFFSSDQTAALDEALRLLLEYHSITAEADGSDDPKKGL
jgi:hypothetical protein